MFGMFLDFFFFKQKTAYEMRISDWSSDVCSSDLQPQRIDAVERLRSGRHLHDGQRAPLRRAHTAHRQRQMIDLRLHDARYLAVPLGAAPHLPLRPEGECAQLMHGGMIVICNLIGQRQGRWIEDRSEEHTSELQSLMRTSYA